MPTKTLHEITYPRLTMAERDRRFALARGFMDDHSLDVLILTGGGSRIFRHWCTNQFYLSNEPDGVGTAVVFPRDSEPVVLTIRTQWGLMTTDADQGVPRWIDDFRLAEPSMVDHIVGILRERKLDRGRAGVLTGAGETQFGALAEPLWQAIQAEVPDLEAMDASVPFTLVTLAKSDEEIEMARAAGRAAENAGMALLAAAGAGASEVDLFAAAQAELVRGGVDQYIFLMSAGKEVMGWGQPRWMFPNRAPRILEPGDTVMAEFFPVYAGIDTQFQMTVSIGEPSADLLHMTDIARASYEAGVAAIKPGVRFDSVWQAMQAPIVESDCWDWDPLIHSLPMQMLGPMHVGLAGREDVHESQRELAAWLPHAGNDIILEKGMLFANEPGIGLGRERVLLGGLIATTADGCEELTTFGSHLHVAE